MKRRNFLKGLLGFMALPVMAKAGAERLAEVFNGEFERGFFKESQSKLVGPVECNGRLWYAQGQEIWSTDLPVLDDYDSRTRTMRYGEDILVAHPDYPPRIFNKKGEYLKELGLYPLEICKQVAIV